MDRRRHVLGFAITVSVSILTAFPLAPARAGHAAWQSSGWVLAHSAPFAGKYEDFAFPNAKDGWLANAGGDVLHTGDGGATWALQSRGLGRLRSIDFLDSRRGFAGTINGVLHATTDGGQTWTDITATLPKTTLGFCGMTHVGERVHIVGKYTGGAADYFYSLDGGRTWSVTDLNSLAYGLVDVSFIDASVGLIGGQARTDGPGGTGPATILKTSDGGKTWRTVFRDSGGRGFAWKIFPVIGKLIFAALQSQDGTYRVAKSTDAGDHWVVKIAATDRPIGPGVQGIGFLDERRGWIGGFFSGLYETSDSGETWSAVPIDGRTVNRFERVGKTMFTASTAGVLRYDSPR